MKRYYLASLFLHVLFFVTATLHHIPEKKQEPVEVTLGESGNDKKGTDRPGQSNVIIPLAGIGEASAELHNFYWGIGISSVEYYKDNMPVIEINEVALGYSAYDAGLQVGDIIVNIDGHSISEGNDIRGDGPKRLSLTIIRKWVTLLINLERVKVYY